MRSELSLVLTIDVAKFILDFSEFKSATANKRTLQELPGPLQEKALGIVEFLKRQGVTTFVYDREDPSASCDGIPLDGPIQSDVVEALDLTHWWLHHTTRLSIAKQRQSDQDLATNQRNAKRGKGERLKRTVVSWRCLDCNEQAPSSRKWCLTADCSCRNNYQLATGETVLQEVSKQKSA